MSYESHAEPIKLGYLFDFKLPPGFPRDQLDDMTDSFNLVFRKGREAGVIDRDIEIVFREVEGLPKGTVKAVIDAYAELVARRLDPDGKTSHLVDRFGVD